MTTSPAPGPLAGLRVVDCSTADYRCLQIGTRFALAMPRRCDALAHRASWNSPIGTLSLYAPMPHQNPPTGAYMLDAFPTVILRYGPVLGYSEASFYTVPVNSPDFELSSPHITAGVVTSDGSALMLCDR
jgi:hypothetical protein